jgi:hypothetical protein
MRDYISAIRNLEKSLATNKRRALGMANAEVEISNARGLFRHLKFDNRTSYE